MPRPQLSRRQFLQFALAGGAAAATAGFLDAKRAYAAPLAPGERALVLVHLAGANDALNTFPPIGAGRAAYDAARPTLRLDPASLLPMDSELGFHPSLVGLQQRWAAGRVGVITGVGSAATNLSHFASTAIWNAGAPASPTGWVGRYVDQLAVTAPLAAVHLGTAVPLTVRSASTSAVALPVDGVPVGGDRSDPFDDRFFTAAAAYGGGPTGTGPWGDALARDLRASLDTATAVTPLYAAALPTGRFAAPLALAARLINANVGVRVVNLIVGSFDSHDGQLAEHAANLAALDLGIETFFAALEPSWQDRATVVLWSEFGRRIAENGSAGTDHGAGGAMVAVGNGVRGGRYGELPDPGRPDARGNLAWSIDFRSVFATVLDDWLGGNGDAVFTPSLPRLSLFVPGRAIERVAAPAVAPAAANRPQPPADPDSLTPPAA